MVTLRYINPPEGSDAAPMVVERQGGAGTTYQVNSQMSPEEVLRSLAKPKPSRTSSSSPPPSTKRRRGPMLASARRGLWGSGI